MYSWRLTRGYHKITQSVHGGDDGIFNTSLIGESYPVYVCSCGDYYTE
jgi:hypothetical protein